MNQFQQNLYGDLMELCNNNEAFYYVDQQVDTKVFRVFTYRLASYTEFCLPNALECRGHTFLMDGDFPSALVCLPPAKFFNAYENPFVMDLDFSQTKFAMDKIDGSLISSVKVDGGYVLKSKTSFASSQAVAAMNLLKKMETEGLTSLKNFIELHAAKNRTVNLEYCAPDNRIVIGYTEPKLTILSVRCNETGRTWYPYDMVREWYDTLDDWICASKYFVDYNVNHPVSIHDRIGTYMTYEEILGMTGIEGFVVVFKDGRVCKVKTEAYCVLHKTKDSINNPKALFQACLYETSDDLRSLFHDDELAMKQITAMETLVRTNFNHISSQLQKFYDENKLLDRKSYAILGQQTFKDGTFSLAMNLYLGKDMGLKDWMMKNYREFGINDVPELEVSTGE